MQQCSDLRRNGPFIMQCLDIASLEPVRHLIDKQFISTGHGIWQPVHSRFKLSEMVSLNIVFFLREGICYCSSIGALVCIETSPDSTKA